jgi:hypothetical protein
MGKARMTFVKVLVVLILLGIVGSLGSALYYLYKDRERSPRTVKALTVRIGLSIGLFFLLLALGGLGLLRPHGIGAGLRQAAPPVQPGGPPAPANPADR